MLIVLYNVRHGDANNSLRCPLHYLSFRQLTRCEWNNADSMEYFISVMAVYAVAGRSPSGCSKLRDEFMKKVLTEGAARAIMCSLILGSSSHLFSWGRGLRPVRQMLYFSSSRCPGRKVLFGNTWLYC